MKDPKCRYEVFSYFPNASEFDLELWNAKEAYRLYWSYGHFVDIYLLCYEKRIVEITFDWKPTIKQMAIAAERLAGE